MTSTRTALSLLLAAALIGCGGSASHKAPRSSYSGGGTYAADSPAAESVSSGSGSDGDGASAGSYAAPSKAPMATGAAAPGGGYAPSAPPPPAAAPAPMGKKSESAPTAMPPVKIETKTTVTITTPPPYTPPVVVDDQQQSATGGLLTAAIWDDHAHRAEFNSFLARYPAFNQQWNIEMSRRVTVRVEDSAGVLVGDAPLALRAPNGSVVNLRTHADGTTYFWPTASMLTYQQGGQGGTFAVAAQVGKLRKEAWFTAPAGDTTWTVRLDGVPARAQVPALDVAFVVDCTGSMGDEISYLQNEIAGVIKHAKMQHAMRRVRLGLVLYRDRGDEYVTKSFGFTEDVNTYLSWLKQAQAGGGGDMPESVNAALADTVQKLDWAGDETGRLAFLVADAPPHYYADEQYTYKNAIFDLNARGVKLVSVGASGIDKTTEYVFRQMSAYTGGRYVFLTDDSGIGDSHLIPDITGYQVEHLDRILARTIAEEAKAFKR
jgi:Mg-chelatase subunit ChlD